MTSKIHINHVVVYWLSIALSSVGVDATTYAHEPKPPTAEELREAKLFEAIGEMAVRRDDLLQKFAVVLWGA